MNTFQLGGITYQSAFSAPSAGKAKGSTSLGLANVGSISTNAGVDLSKVTDFLGGGGEGKNQGQNGGGLLTGGIKLTKDNGNVFTSGAAERSHEKSSHKAISSYFIGPQAENIGLFRDNINGLLDQVVKARKNYFPDDGDFITKEIQNSTEFLQRAESLANATRALGQSLGQHSIPFWSPRYQGHMCMDMSMPALLGYFTTMIYNPNNVAFEASPISTLAELEVGKQLSEMFGYNVSTQDEDKDSKPDASGPDPWGHVTCDGTIANLESMWAARNLKFYPLSLCLAFKGPLSNVAETFKVQTADGREDLLINLSTWELLNLRVETILDLPDRLTREYGISSAYIDQVMNEYGIQSRGKDTLERQYGLKATPQYFVANTKHYSWPKSAAIAGIGSENMVGIPVDDGARISVVELKRKLDEKLANQEPVYGVVAIIGTTEEGAVDPLGEILALRDHYRSLGLSFVVHADAAWGGYFASMMPKNVPQNSDDEAGDGGFGFMPPKFAPAAGFVPGIALRNETQHAMLSLRRADSITVDPHKAGYVPYPAGGLAYRDGRMRHLLTWNAPYLSQGSDLNIGVYGVEGSKPGASAVSTYMANASIGLNEDGYGALLSEVSFTCGRFAAQWAAMTDDTMPFTVVPLNMLPSELVDDCTPAKVEQEKRWIRQNILSSSNTAIVENSTTSPGGDSALQLIRKLGSDLNINAFACNFRYSNGKLNTDPDEANYFMRRIVDHLSVSSPDDDPTTIPLYLTSTVFTPEEYGDCLSKFKQRLGLQDGPEELFVLRNVVMSPFPTERDFVAHLAGIFREHAEKAVKVCRGLNEDTADKHTFLLQGEDPVFLLHKPSFYVPNHRRQTILEIALPDEAKEFYLRLKKEYPKEIFTFNTSDNVELTEVIKNKGKLHGNIGTSAAHDTPSLSDFTLTITESWLDRELNGVYLASRYPSDRMPFYLYGHHDQSSSCSSSSPSCSSVHIDHALLRSPNIQLSAADISLSLEKSTSSSNSTLPFSTATNTSTTGAKRPLLLFLESVREKTMQPFPSTNKSIAELPNFFFQPGAKFNVSVWRDPMADKSTANGEEILKVWEALGSGGDDEGGNGNGGFLVGRGTVTLGESVFVDGQFVNLDPHKKMTDVDGWKREFKEIGKQFRH
ncbi:pyridoxal phosphate-dependent transferase [Coniella lustricola]|uniref:Pyridoxal phosphate-dependent transferase n=1 Tax=Coniella lustricola TaxID=2025994 RepID=A0A2T3AL79_9PEZI|nr:pyridoxal phosphate-dependent transferase [Coniella lustricola]